MLERDLPERDLSFPKALDRYLEQLLHGRFDIRPLRPPSSLPAFIGRTYMLYEARVLDRRFIIMAKDDELGTPAEIAKHIEIVRKATNATVAFATKAISSHNRARLIGQGIPFIVPGNQLYFPDLGIDLREHFRAPRLREAEALSPAAQMVLFHHLLHPERTALTPTQLGEHLQYSSMSVGRAFDYLVAADLADTVKSGKERHIHFRLEGRALFDKATPFLRSPIRTIKFVRGVVSEPTLKIAGETALSSMTDLAPPRLRTFAVAATNWKAVSQTYGLTEVDRQDADCIIETWCYDPAILSDTPLVDVLSLYAQFREHRDERVAMAADHLLENITW